MNTALIHDRLHIKTFWETRISNQCQSTESEEQRMERSALKNVDFRGTTHVTSGRAGAYIVTITTNANRLRGEWLVRLENRTKHLKNVSDYVRKTRTEKSADQT